jgi:hypothetical protein
MSRLRVYVAGKLTDTAVEYLKNCHRMTALVHAARKAGYAPLNPCEDLLEAISYGDLEYGECVEVSLAWLEAAEVVLLQPVGIKESKGSQKEIARAQALNIPIVESLEELQKKFPVETGG